MVSDSNTQILCPEQIINQECIIKEINTIVTVQEESWGEEGRRINEGSSGENIQIVAIKHVYVQFKGFASESHIMDII